MNNNVNNRMSKIKDYFVNMNMGAETTVVLVKFPPKWKVFDKDNLVEKYEVYTAKKENVDGVFFASDTSNGIDCIFDAIDEVVEVNKTLEEKAALFEKKTKELSDLFVSEPIERLKMLEFTFGDKKSLKMQKKTIKEENVETSEVCEQEDTRNINNEQESECAEEEVQAQEQIEEEVVESPKKPKKNKKKEKDNDDSDLMEFMKDLTGEK